MPADPFALTLPATPGPLRLASRAGLRIASRLLGLDACRAIYIRVRTPSSESFAARVLQALTIVPDYAATDLLHIPSSGPLIVAANHPCGGLDGLVLLSLIQRVRPDVKLVANHLLARVPEIASLCFFADPFGGASAGLRSLGGLRSARRWLGAGGALIVFPSGEVAHRRDAGGAYTDSPWHTTIGRIAIASRAQVVPAFVAGRNRRRFYAAGRIHPLLRTALLPRELLAKRGARIGISIGNAASSEELLRSAPESAAVTQCIREMVEALGVRHARKACVPPG